MQKSVDIRKFPGARKPCPEDWLPGSILESSHPGQLALDRMPTGLVWLDGLGMIQHLNLAARDFLSGRDGLGIAGDRLTIGGRVGELLQRILTGRRICAFRVSRPSGRKDYAVVVTPLDETSAAERCVAGFLVSITDTDASPPVEAEVLCQLWSLTVAEARVAAALVEGLTLAEIAQRDGVSQATVRCQTKAIFQKTGTRRQSQLVRLVMSLVQFATRNTVLASVPGNSGSNSRAV